MKFCRFCRVVGAGLQHAGFRVSDFGVASSLDFKLLWFRGHTGSFACTGVGAGLIAISGRLVGLFSRLVGKYDWLFGLSVCRVLTSLKVVMNEDLMLFLRTSVLSRYCILGHNPHAPNLKRQP